MCMDQSAMDTNSVTHERKERRRKLPIRVVMRRLPGGMTCDYLLAQLEPLPDIECYDFISADSGFKSSYSRVYFAFKDENEAVLFRNRFNGYVFIDATGQESIALVELAPNPTICRHMPEDSKKRDKLCATLESESCYETFASSYNNWEKHEFMPLDQLVKEIEEYNRTSVERMFLETPLIQSLKKKFDIRRKSPAKEDRISKFKNMRGDDEVRSTFSSKSESVKEEKKRKESNRNADSKHYVRFYRSKFHPDDNDSLRDKRQKSSKDRDRSWNVETDSWKQDGSARKNPVRSSAKRFERERQAANNGFKENRVERKHLVSDTLAKDEGNLEKSETPPLIISRRNSNHKSVDTPKECTDRAEKKKETVDLAKDARRRNKDRPERAIYRPGVARRFAALSGNARKSEAADKK